MNQKHEREQMNVVIVGHVDHGKSTLIGRLLADTGALPEGKLEAVKANCERNAKPFEYAFLLDALKDEQAQGITIDTARCFFKSKKRDYIIIDAPGHIEFLKNMVSGAARAEAAVLVIDAHEGIQENSKRHGYMMSFLGIRNITVCVNKMDLVGYQQDVFDKIKKEYLAFLDEINIKPDNFIPISAREGANIAGSSEDMPWYQGASVLEALDNFKKKAPKSEQTFRFPVQDIYKFTAKGDDRRIFAGRVETGTVAVGDEIIFLPSGKTSRIKSIEGFNAEPKNYAFSGESTGFCLDTQIYVRPGEIMCRKADRQPFVSTKFRANLFWMGRLPLVKNKNYKLKIATQHIPVQVSEIISVLDASELSSIQQKNQVDRHDVAECVFETLKPVAFDEVVNVAETGRFVLVDNYEISGGGIILAPVFDENTSIKEHVRRREENWERSGITPQKRALKYQHKSALVILAGQADVGKQKVAKTLEEELFNGGKNVYFLGISNQVVKAVSGSNDKVLNKIDYVQQLGELSHILTDAGLILVTSITDVDNYELKILKSLAHPSRTLVVEIGPSGLDAGQVDLKIEAGAGTQAAVAEIQKHLNKVIGVDPEYTI